MNGENNIVICSWKYYNQSASSPYDEDEAQEIYVAVCGSSAQLKHPNYGDHSDLFTITRNYIEVKNDNHAIVSLETSFGVIETIFTEKEVTIHGENWSGEDYDNVLNTILDAIGKNSS